MKSFLPPSSARLQKQHPLPELAEMVLGSYADVALPKLRPLPQDTARLMLRGALKSIPDGQYQRRWKYVRTCIQNHEADRAAEMAVRTIDNLDPDELRTIDDEDLSDLYADLPKQREYRFIDLRQRLKDEKLTMRLWKVAVTRHGPDWLNNICRLACNAKHPARYVRTVLDNDVKATRKPSAKIKRKGKLVKKRIGKRLVARSEQREQIIDKGIADPDSPD